MAAFTAQDVKTLREKTGCGMMDCKKTSINCANMDIRQENKQQIKQCT